MLSVFMLSVTIMPIMLSVIMFSAVLLNVVAPLQIPPTLGQSHKETYTCNQSRATISWTMHDLPSSTFLL